jgi:hypothetical protein
MADAIAELKEAKRQGFTHVRGDESDAEISEFIDFMESYRWEVAS